MILLILHLLLMLHLKPCLAVFGPIPQPLPLLPLFFVHFLRTTFKHLLLYLVLLDPLLACPFLDTIFPFDLSKVELYVVLCVSHVKLIHDVVAIIVVRQIFNYRYRLDVHGVTQKVIGIQFRLKRIRCVQLIEILVVLI